MSDLYDAKARDLIATGANKTTIAALARESVREAMLGLAATMCRECADNNIPVKADCGTWYEHRNGDFQVGCTASHVWNWLKAA
jgi:hypothetical protein